MASIYRLGTKWRAQVRLKGKPSQSEVFDSKSEAQKWARSIEGSLHKTNASDDLVTYAEIHKKYFEGLQHCGKTKKKVCDALEVYWGGYRLSEITGSTISDYATKRQRAGVKPSTKRQRAGVKPSTILTDLVYFGVVLQHGGVLTNNEEALRARLRLSSTVTTLRNTKVVASSKRRTRRPTEEELLKLEDFFFRRKLSQVPMWDIVLFAICTAMRLGEIVGPGGITWVNLDEDQRLLAVLNRKDPDDPEGHDDIIPLLTGPVTLGGKVIDPVEILLIQKSARDRRPLSRVFPYAEGTVTQAFNRACRLSQISDLHFHDLRHEAISRLFEAGYSIPEVAKVSGHRSWKNLERYTQIRPETLHARNV